jgi:hypothetical protein
VELTAFTHVGDRDEGDLALLREILDAGRQVGREFVDDDPRTAYFADLDRPLPADLICESLS